MIAFHGTNQDFEAFDPDRMGLANPNEASRIAVFFARTAATAWAYAESAARKLVPDQDAHEAMVERLLEQARAAERRRDYRASEALHLEAEALEAAALSAAPAGARVLVCDLDLENPLEVDGTSRAVMVDLGAVLAAARTAGHDGVIIRGISDTPAGALEPDDHIAVFRTDRIRILEVRHAPGAEPEARPEP